MKLAFPELGAPPKHWTAGRHGTSIVLVPPGAYLDRSRASIRVSPLVPITEAMPAIPQLLDQALDTEVQAHKLQVSHRDGQPTQSTTGLSGYTLEVVLTNPKTQETQHRVYTMYRDDALLYGIHYIADKATFPVFVETYRTAASSVIPRT